MITLLFEFILLGLVGGLIGYSIGIALKERIRYSTSSTTDG